MWRKIRIFLTVIECSKNKLEIAGFFGVIALALIILKRKPEVAKDWFPSPIE